MAEGGRQCSSSRSTDKLSLLDTLVPTVPPFLQSHQQHGSATAHLASSQQSFDNSLPPGRQPIQALMVSQCCLLKTFFFHLLPSTPLFLFSSLIFSENAWCFFHFSNLNSPLSLFSLLSEKAQGGLFIFSPLIVFHLFPYDTELSPQSLQLPARELEKTHG